MSAIQYTVKSGDTLWGIAQRYLGSGSRWRELGYRGDPRTLPVGYKLTIPGRSNQSTPTASQQARQQEQTRNQTPQESGNDLNQYQNDIFEKLDQLKSPFKSEEEIKANVEAELNVDQPTAPNLENVYNQMRQAGGLDKLESALQVLQAQYREEENRLRSRRSAIENDIVPMDVIAGRENEVTRQEKERLDYIGRQIQVVEDQLNSQYKIIDTIMKIKQADYDNAFREYQAKFDEKLQVLNAVQKTQAQQFNEGFQILTWKQKTATAQLQIYADMITKGELNPRSLDPDTKNHIHKLEIASGLGIGFLDRVHPPVGSEIKSVTRRRGADGYEYADTLIVNPDGSLRVKSIRLGRFYVAPRTVRTRRPSQAEILRGAVAKMNSIIKTKNVLGEDGYMAPDTYKRLRSDWVGAGFDPTAYDKYFSGYVNPNHWWDYGSQLKNYFE